MDIKEYNELKTTIEREYRYYCIDSSFRRDDTYKANREYWRKAYNKIAEWETRILEAALTYVDESYFREI